MTTNEHLFKIKIDDAGVIRTLQSLGAEISKISSQAVAASLPNLSGLGGTSGIPASMTPSQVGQSLGKLQAEVARFIAQGQPNYNPAKDIPVAIKDAVRTAFEQALTPFFNSLKQNQLGVVRRQAERAFEKGIVSQKVDAKTRVTEAADPENNDVKRGLARKASIIDRINAIEESLGRQVSSEEELRKLTNQALKERLRGLQDENFFAEVRRDAARKVESYSRVANNGPGILAEGEAYGRGSGKIISGEAADITRADRDLLDRIVKSDVKIADLKAEELTQLYRILGTNEQSLRLAAEERIAKEDRNAAVKAEAAQLRRANQTPEDIQREVDAAYRDRDNELRQKRQKEIDDAYRQNAKDTQVNPDRLATELRQNNDRLATEEQKLRQEINKNARAAAKASREAAKAAEAAAKAAEAEAAELDRLAKEVGPVRAQFIRTAKARLEERDGTVTVADEDYLKSLSQTELKTFTDALPFTQKELEAKKKAADVEQRRLDAKQKAADREARNNDIVGTADDRRRKSDIRGIGKIEQQLQDLGVPVQRFTNDDLANLPAQTIRDIKNTLVERLRQEREGLTAAERAAAEQKRLAREIGPAREKLIRSIVARQEELTGKVTQGDIEALRQRSTADLRALNNSLPLTSEEQRRAQEQQRRAQEQQRRAQEQAQRAADRAARQAAAADTVAVGDSRRRRSNIVGIGKLEQQLGIPEAARFKTADFVGLPDNLIAEIKEILVRRVKAEAAALGLTQDEVRAKRRQNELIGQILRNQELSAARGIVSPFARFDNDGLEKLPNEDLIRIRDSQKTFLTPPPPPKPPKPPAPPDGPLQGPPNLLQEAQEAIARERVDTARRLLTLEQRTVYDYEQLGALAAARKRSQAQLQAAEFGAMRADREYMEARALRNVEERKYINEQRKINARIAREQGFGGTNILSRFLGRFSGGDNGGPLGPTGGIPPTLGEFFGRGAANLARYAIPGSIGYGAINAVTSTIREAEELDRVFASVEAQFAAISSSEKEAEDRFKAFRSEILKTARETGVAADELANIGFQLQGAFGDKTIDGVSGTRLVQSQTEAAAEISRVTGLSAKEITDSLTAASFGFDASFREIGNVTINLQDRFGVLAKEIIPFLGDIAPVAREAGFELEEFATIAALTQQRSGRSGSALAEAYGRVIPAVTNARTQLVELATTNDNLSTDYIDKVSSGSIKDVFFAVAQNFESMNKSSKEFVVNLLGGRREAAAILPVFSDSAALAAEIEKTGQAGDVLAERFARIQETLTQSLARLNEQFRQLGVAVFEAGLGDALKLVVELLSLVAGGLKELLGLFSSLNEATGGWATKVLLLAGALKALGAVNATSRLNSPVTAAIRGQRLAADAAYVNVLRDGYGRTAANAAVGNATRGSVRGALGPGGKLAADTSAGMFARGAVLAVATEVAIQFAGWVGSVKDGVKQAQSEYAGMQEQELQKELAKLSDPFEGNFFSDFKQNLRRGIVGKDFDRRNIIQEELNRQRFEATGAQPLVRGQEVALADIGSGDALRSALTQDDVLASIVDPMTRVFGKDLRGLEKVAKGGNENAKLFIDAIRGSVTERQAAFLALIDKAATDQQAFAFLFTLRNLSPELQKAIDKFTEQKKNADDVSKVQTGSSELARGLETVKASFEAGQVSVIEYLNALESSLNTQKRALAAIQAQGGDPSETLKRIFELEKTIAELRSNSAFTSSNLLQEFFEIGQGKGDVSDKANIDRLVKLIESGELNPKGRIEAANQVVTLLQSLDEAMVIPDSVREVLAEAYFDPKVNTEWAAFLAQWTNAFGTMSIALANELFIGIALGKKTVADVIAIINEREAAVASIPADELLAAGGSAGGGGAGISQQNAESLRRQAETIAERIGSTVPKVAASSKKDSETADDLADAKADYYRALIEGDPVALAEFNVQEAERRIAEAEKESDRWRAMADKVRAERALEAARFEVDTGWADLWVAYYEYYGDNVKAAEAALEQAFEARRRIDELAKTGGAGTTDVLKSEADLLRAKANVRDTRLAEQKDEYQFLYDMGKITKAQLIQYLEGLKQIPDLTNAQIRDIDRQIKQLRGELAQDLQFNLPSQFRLPTLYEVRRTGQAGSTQAGYVDNRNVVITLNVNNGASQQQMVQLLTDVVGSPARVSSGVKRY